MDQSLEFDVATLDAPHRRALEDLLGTPLAANQHIIIHVLNASSDLPKDPRPAQSVEDWTSLYAGLSDQEIDEIDQAINSRDRSSREIH